MVRWDAKGATIKIEGVHVIGDVSVFIGELEKRIRPVGHILTTTCTLDRLDLVLENRFEFEDEVRILLIHKGEEYILDFWVDEGFYEHGDVCMSDETREILERLR